MNSSHRCAALAAALLLTFPAFVSAQQPCQTGQDCTASDPSLRANMAAFDLLATSAKSDPAHVANATPAGRPGLQPSDDDPLSLAIQSHLEKRNEPGGFLSKLFGKQRPTKFPDFETLPGSPTSPSAADLQATHANPAQSTYKVLLAAGMLMLVLVLYIFVKPFFASSKDPQKSKSAVQQPIEPTVQSGQISPPDELLFEQPGVRPGLVALDETPSFRQDFNLRASNAQGGWADLVRRCDMDAVRAARIIMGECAVDPNVTADSPEAIYRALRRFGN